MTVFLLGDLALHPRHLPPPDSHLLQHLTRSLSSATLQSLVFYSFCSSSSSCHPSSSVSGLTSSTEVNRIFIFNNSTALGLLLFLQFIISHQCLPSDSLLVQQLTESSSSASQQPKVFYSSSSGW